MDAHVSHDDAQMSSKFLSKVSKVASTMSRFLRGDDDDEAAKQRDQELFSSALRETSSLKVAFFRTPSKDRVCLSLRMSSCPLTLQDVTDAWERVCV